MQGCPVPVVFFDIVMLELSLIARHILDLLRSRWWSSRGHPQYDDQNRNESYFGTAEGYIEGLFWPDMNAVVQQNSST